MGFTNPKSFIVLAAILPQFVDPRAGAIPAQMLQLAMIPIGMGMITDSIWALAASQARIWINRPRARRAMGRIGGLCLIGLGLALAVDPIEVTG